jgi:hypothetical protein
MPASNISLKIGSEWHVSSWGKFIAKGLDFVPEHHSGGTHHNYTAGYSTAEAGTIFTVWQSSGDKYGTHSADFWICEALPADSDGHKTLEGGHSRGYAFLGGTLRVLAHGAGYYKARRLLGWTVKAQEAGPLTKDLAEHFGREIERRGAVTPAPLAVAA